MNFKDFFASVKTKNNLRSEVLKKSGSINNAASSDSCYGSSDDLGGSKERLPVSFPSKSIYKPQVSSLPNVSTFAKDSLGVNFSNKGTGLSNSVDHGAGFIKSDHSQRYINKQNFRSTDSGLGFGNSTSNALLNSSTCNFTSRKASRQNLNGLTNSLPDLSSCETSSASRLSQTKGSNTFLEHGSTYTNFDRFKRKQEREISSPVDSPQVYNCCNNQNKSSSYKPGKAFERPIIYHAPNQLAKASKANDAFTTNEPFGVDHTQKLSYAQSQTTPTFSGRISPHLIPMQIQIPLRTTTENGSIPLERENQIISTPIIQPIQAPATVVKHDNPNVPASISYKRCPSVYTSQKARGTADISLSSHTASPTPKSSINPTSVNPPHRCIFSHPSSNLRDFNMEEAIRRAEHSQTTQRLFSSINVHQSESRSPFNKHTQQKLSKPSERLLGSAFGNQKHDENNSNHDSINNAFHTEQKHRQALVAKINAKKMEKLSGQGSSNASFSFTPAPLPLIPEHKNEQNFNNTAQNNEQGPTIVSPATLKRTEAFFKIKQEQIRKVRNQKLSPESERRNEVFLKKKMEQKDSYTKVEHSPNTKRRDEAYLKTNQEQPLKVRNRELSPESERRLEAFLQKKILQKNNRPKVECSPNTIKRNEAFLQQKQKQTEIVRKSELSPESERRLEAFLQKKILQKNNRPKVECSPNTIKRNEAFLQQKQKQTEIVRKSELSPESERRNEAFLKKKMEQKNNRTKVERSQDSMRQKEAFLNKNQEQTVKVSKSQLSPESERKNEVCAKTKLVQMNGRINNERSTNSMIENEECFKNCNKQNKIVTMRQLTPKVETEKGVKDYRKGSTLFYELPITSIKCQLTSLQRKQTKEHFDLDADPDHFPPEIWKQINPFPYHIYGGKRPHMQSNPDNHNLQRLLHQMGKIFVTTPTKPCIRKECVNDTLTTLMKDEMGNKPLTQSPVETASNESTISDSAKRVSSDSTNTSSVSKGNNAGNAGNALEESRVSVGGNVINLSTTELLTANTEITDEILNAYLILTTKLAREQGRKIDAVSSNFLAYDGMETELELNDICENVTSLYIPFYSPGHWALFHANFAERTIEVIDSLYISDAREPYIYETFCKLCHKLKTKFPNSDWRYLPRKQNIALQNEKTHNDCGVFVMAQTCNRIHMNSWLPSLSQEEVLGFRFQVFEDFKAELTRQRSTAHTQLKVTLNPSFSNHVTFHETSVTYEPEDFENQNVINQWLCKQMLQLPIKPYAVMPAVTLTSGNITQTEAFTKCMGQLRPRFQIAPTDSEKIIFCMKYKQRWIMLSVEPLIRQIVIFDSMPTAEDCPYEVQRAMPLVELLQEKYSYGSWKFCHKTGIPRTSQKSITLTLMLWYYVHLIQDKLEQLSSYSLEDDDFEKFEMSVGFALQMDSDSSSAENSDEDTDITAPARTNVFSLSRDNTFNSASCTPVEVPEVSLVDTSDTEDNLLNICVLCAKNLHKDKHGISINPTKVNKSSAESEVIKNIEFMKETVLADVFQGGKRICSRTCATLVNNYARNLKRMKQHVDEILQRKLKTTVSDRTDTSKLCVTCNLTLLTRQKSKLTSLSKRGDSCIADIIGEMSLVANLNARIEGQSSGCICPICKNTINSFQSANAIKKDAEAKLLKIKDLSLNPKSTMTRKATEPTGITPKSKKTKRRTILLEDEANDQGPPPDPLIQDTNPIVNVDDTGVTTARRLVIEKEFEHLISSSGWKTDGTPTDEQISTFDFGTMQTFLKDNCPQICTFFSEDSTGNVIILPPQIMAVCILAFSRNRKFNLLQKILALDLFRSTSKKQSDYLQTLGVCVSRSTTYKTADELNKKNYAKLLKWKKVEENQWTKALLTGAEVSENATYATPSSIAKANSKFRRNLEEEFQCISLQDECSYAIQLDNIDYYLMARHQGILNCNKMKNETVGFVVRSRIPPKERSLAVKRRAVSLEDSEFFLTPEEEDEIRKEKVALLVTIACLHIDALKPFNSFDKLQSIPFDKENRQRSVVIPTGVIPSNISKLKGGLEVLSKLEYLMPAVQGKKVPLRIGGDGATFFLINSCKILRAASLNHETYNHIYPSSASNRFHKSMIRLQRNFQVFDLDNRKSSVSEGSLANIKLTQKHPNANTRTTETYHQGQGLSEASLHGLSCLLLMKHLHIASLDSPPPPGINPMDRVEVQAWLEAAAHACVVEIESSVLPPTASKSRICCVCNKSTNVEGTFCSLLACSNFAHFCCIKSLNPDLAFVKEVVVNKKTKAKQVVEGMYCSEMHADQKYNYSMALLHSALEFKVRRDAIRANNTRNLLFHNKSDLQFFYKHGNFQYFKICLHFLLTQNDCSNPFVKFEERFNSTINMQGLPNRNLSGDRVQELIVKKSKQEIKAHSGSPNMNSVQRRTQFIGSVEPVEEALTRLNCRKYNQKLYLPREFLLETIDFVDRYEKANLLMQIGIRTHDGITHCRYAPFVSDEEKGGYLVKIRKLLQDFDLKADILTNFNTDERGSREFAELPTLKEKTFWVVGKDLARTNPCFQIILKHFPKVRVPNDVQYEVAERISLGHDAVMITPTGFGKSLAFIYANLLKHVGSNSDRVTVSLIVSPLLSIVADQIHSLQKMDLGGVHLTSSNFEEVKGMLNGLNAKCNYEKVLFVFVMPEFFRNGTSIQFLKSLDIKQLVIDEFHLIKTWGEDFRPCFNEIGKFRMQNYHGPVLALSATVGKTEFDIATQSLNLRINDSDTLFSLASPNRPNVHISLQDPRFKNKFFNRVIAGIVHYGINFPKTLLYFESLSDLKDAYLYFMSDLRGAAYNGQTNDVYSRMINMYFADQGQDTKSFILSTFRCASSTLRVVLCTNSFALGVDIPDLRIVAYCQSQRKKKEPDLMEYLQSFGRSGRDGLPAMGILFSKDIPKDTCTREVLLAVCQLNDEPAIEIPSVSDLQKPCFDKCGSYCFCGLCTCCSFCRNSCSCQHDTPKDYLDYFIPPAVNNAEEEGSDEEDLW